MNKIRNIAIVVAASTLSLVSLVALSGTAGAATSHAKHAKFTKAQTAYLKSVDLVSGGSSVRQYLHVTSDSALVKIGNEACKLAAGKDPNSRLSSYYFAVENEYGVTNDGAMWDLLGFDAHILCPKEVRLNPASSKAWEGPSAQSTDQHDTPASKPVSTDYTEGYNTGYSGGAVWKTANGASVSPTESCTAQAGTMLLTTTEEASYVAGCVAGVAAAADSNQTTTTTTAPSTGPLVRGDPPAPIGSDYGYPWDYDTTTTPDVANLGQTAVTDLSNTVCYLFSPESGMTPGQASTSLVDSYAVPSAQDATTIIVGATFYLCPQYEGVVAAWYQADTGDGDPFTS